MKTKKHLTAQEFQWLIQYLDAEYNSVDYAYGRPSETKRQIEQEILYDMNQQFHGFDYRIISHNGFHFSCGFKFTENDNNFLCICTPSRWYYILPVITVDEETGEVKNWYEDYLDYKKMR